MGHDDFQVGGVGREVIDVRGVGMAHMRAVVARHPSANASGAHIDHLRCAQDIDHLKQIVATTVVDREELQTWPWPISSSWCIPKSVPKIWQT